MSTNNPVFYAVVLEIACDIFMNKTCFLVKHIVSVNYTSCPFYWVNEVRQVCCLAVGQIIGDIGK